MTVRNRRIVPGMIASLLLALPLLPTQAHAEAHVFAPANPDRSFEQRRTSVTRPKSSRHHVLARRRTAPAVTPASTVSSTVAFFDDGAGWRQSGIASWYGGARWQGHRTASGARYEQDDLTAAHATLPLGTRVRVALVGTDRSVIVTINDRPGTHSRIIDLSRGAARALGILDRGVAQVTLSTP